MKWYILIIAVILSSCSTNQGPPETNSSSIPGLSVTDSLNFGSIPLGTSKKLSLRLQNISSDTIEITSQSLSNSNFSFSDSLKQQFAIAPGEIKWVTIQYTAKDTSMKIAYDTVRVSNRAFIVVLRSSGNFFSSMFSSAPTSIVVSLNDLIGHNSTYNETQYFNLSFTAASGLLQWGDTLVFDGDFENNNNPYDGDAFSETQSMRVWLHLDTGTHTVDWLKATSTYSKSSWLSIHGGTKDGTYAEYDKNQYLAIHGILLSKNATTWPGALRGMSVASAVDSAQFYDYGYALGPNPPSYQGTLGASIGYDSTSSLSISIR